MQKHYMSTDRWFLSNKINESINQNMNEKLHNNLYLKKLIFPLRLKYLKFLLQCIALRINSRKENFSLDELKLCPELMFLL
jgi:hypothetical protein